MKQRVMIICLGIVLLSAVPGKADLIVFGDSLSDTGNTHRATNGLIPAASEGYYQGRFADGNNWVDHLAGFLGESAPIASRNGGKNYAHGGSQVLTTGLLRPNLFEQVGNLTSANATDLHVIWAGGNDLLSVDLDDTIDNQRLRSRQVAAGINANIDTLYTLGARRFLVLNLPDLGALPLSQATLSNDNRAELTDLTLNYNRELAQEMTKARNDNGEINLVEFDVHSFFEDAIANPGDNGFTNTTDSATPFDPDGSAFFPAGLATGLPGDGVNPDEYLFYDGLHPSARAHELLAGGVASVMSVPEPSHVAILLVGSLMILGRGVLRKRRG